LRTPEADLSEEDRRALGEHLNAAALQEDTDTMSDSDDDTRVVFVPGDTDVDEFLDNVEAVAQSRRTGVDDRLKMETAFIHCNSEARRLLAPWRRGTVPGAHVNTTWNATNTDARPTWDHFKDAFTTLFKHAGTTDRREAEFEKLSQKSFVRLHVTSYLDLAHRAEIVGVVRTSVNKTIIKKFIKSFSNANHKRLKRHHQGLSSMRTHLRT
jgi:hypothetical protein